MNEFLIELQAKLDEASLKGIKGNLDQLKKEFEELQIKPVLDQRALSDLSMKINKLLTDNKITISNINVDSGQSVKKAQQAGQQIGDAINQGVESSVKNANNALKSFSDLTNFSELHNKISNVVVKNESELKDYKVILDQVKNTYAEFGQVKITNEFFNKGNLKSFKVNIEQVNGDLKETKSFVMSLNNNGDAFVFDGIIKGSENVVQHLDKTKNAINQTADAINNLKFKTQADKFQLSMETDGYESKVESLIAKTQQWTDKNGEARISTTALSTALKNLSDASTALLNSNTVENQKALIVAEKELDTQIKKVTNSIRIMNSETMKSSAVDSLRQKYQEFYDKNGAAHRQWGTQLKQAMLELASGAEISKQRGEELKQELIQIQNAARQAGKLGKSGLQKLFEGFKSFTYWTSSTFLVMKAIQSIKGGIGTVRSLDTALVDLKKTTTMTSSELENFYYDSNKVAKQMGVTTKEIINQASAWSRLNKIGLLYGNI